MALFLENTAGGEAEVKDEVTRYITWPGQVCNGTLAMVFSEYHSMKFYIIIREDRPAAKLYKYTTSHFRVLVLISVSSRSTST